MRIFLAGAAGAIGRRLVPLLTAARHQVVGTSRTPAKFDLLRSLGAEPLALDGLDRDAVMKAVSASRPDVVVHQMTAISGVRSLKNFDREFATTNRLRTEGARYLLDAAQASGAKKFVAQSYTGWPNERRGSRVKTEEDPLDSDPPRSMAKALDAIRTVENLVLRATSLSAIALRYGSYYGPGTSIALAPDGEIIAMVRQRKLPLVGSAAGVWSFIHIDDAANATKLAIEGSATGIFNITDDEPAEVSTWLPYLAECIGAPPPRRVPSWLAKFAIGEVGVAMMTTMRGSANGKAKRAFSWHPKFASWREGFRHALSDPLAK